MKLLTLTNAVKAINTGATLKSQKALLEAEGIVIAVRTKTAFINEVEALIAQHQPKPTQPKPTQPKQDTNMNMLPTHEELQAVCDNLNSDWMMEIPMDEAPHVQHKAPVATNPTKSYVAPKKLSLAQVAQLVATSVTKNILDDYKVLPEKAAMASLAVIRTMFGINEVASYDTYMQAAMNAARYTNSKNNDKKALHLKTDGHGILVMAEKVGYVTFVDGDVHPTEKWNALMVEHTPVSPKSSPISKKKGERLRKNIMKSNAKASRTMQQGVHFLEATEYSVHTPTLDNVLETFKACEEAAHAKVMEGKSHLFANSVQYKIAYRKQLNEFFPEELSMVLQGCNAVRDEASLWSEYDADARGRLYHVMCFGPNPQASDLARATYSLNTLVPVQKDTPAYELFMEELHDISGGKFKNHETIMAVAKSPVAALTKWMTKGGETPKKPFTYARMCETYANFHNNGEATCTIGYGLDAKCSGTQYLAIIAGDLNMMEATGVTQHPVRVADPYVQSLRILERIMPEAVSLGLDRDFIKTPYMAVQYGGTKNALVDSRDFCIVLEEKGITSPAQIEEVAEACVVAITEALGDKINKFIKEVAISAKRKCDELGKEYFPYFHTDAQKVIKPGFLKEEICPSFIIRIEEGEQLVFGQLDENGKPHGTWKMTSRDMDRKEFARTFVVNFIQGIDALVARTFVVHAERAGLRGVTSIHDCFRCILADAPLMMDVIRSTYKEVFVDNNQLENLRRQLGQLDFYTDNMVTEELLDSEHAYYFCI